MEPHLGSRSSGGNHQLSSQHPPHKRRQLVRSGSGRPRPVVAYIRLAAPAFHLPVEKYAQNRGQYEMHFGGDAKRSAIQRNPTDLIIQRVASDAILSQRRAVIIWRWSMIQPCLNTVHLSSM